MIFHFCSMYLKHQNSLLHTVSCILYITHTHLVRNLCIWAPSGDTDPPCISLEHSAWKVQIKKWFLSQCSVITRRRQTKLTQEFLLMDGNTVMPDYFTITLCTNWWRRQQYIFMFIQKPRKRHNVYLQRNTGFHSVHHANAVGTNTRQESFH